MADYVPLWLHAKRAYNLLAREQGTGTEFNLEKEYPALWMLQWIPRNIPSLPVRDEHAEIITGL